MRPAGGDRAALAALLAGAAAIAFAPIFVRASELEPTATAFYRFLFALPFLWLWRGAERRRETPPPRPLGLRGRAPLVLAGLFFACDMGFWHWSIAYTSVANATLLANTAPVFVVLGGWLLFGRRVSALFLAGMALAMGGAALLMQASAASGPGSLLGDLFGVVTGVFYAAYLMTVERLRARCSTATVMAHAAPASAVAALAASLALGESLTASSLAGWAVLVGLAVVSQVLGQSLIAFGLARLPVAFASVSLLAQPLLAAALAWLLLGEEVSLVQGLGGLAVLAGIAVSRRGSRARR